MKLWYSPTSPFTRKVLILAHETGQAEGIELLPVNPWAADSEVHRDNPLGKIPVLITDEGERLYESSVICDHLDTLHRHPRLIPPSGPDRRNALRRQSVADGLLDAAMLVRAEMAMRPAGLTWNWWIDRQNTIVDRSLHFFEQEHRLDEGFPTIGDIAVFCALSYLDLRFPDRGWRQAHPRLARWHGLSEQRASARVTAPAHQQT